MNDKEDLRPERVMIVSEQQRQQLIRDGLAKDYEGEKAPAQRELPSIPDNVPRRCSHGTFLWPCAWPSCPNGAGPKRRVRLLFRHKDGGIRQGFFRRRMRVIDDAVVFDWTPDK